MEMLRRGCKEGKANAWQRFGDPTTLFNRPSGREVGGCSATHRRHLAYAVEVRLVAHKPCSIVSLLEQQDVADTKKLND
jgi:hypothetical protein